MTTDTLLSRVRQACELLVGTIKGPWQIALMDCGDYDSEHIVSSDGTTVTGQLHGVCTDENRRLMAAAPGLADLVSDLWAEVDRLRTLGPDTEARVLVEARAIAADMMQPAVSSWREHAATLMSERDEARRDLARIVQLCGWDCDGNDPESPTGAIHLYADAVQAVRELVEERAEDSREIVLLHRLCRDAADVLNDPTAVGGEVMDAMADLLRAAAGHDTDTNDRSA